MQQMYFPVYHSLEGFGKYSCLSTVHLLEHHSSVIDDASFSNSIGHSCTLGAIETYCAARSPLLFI